MTRTRIFWSIYCIVVGLALLVKIVFHLDFSSWAVAFAILLLESGVFLLTGGFGMNRTRHASGGGDYVFFNGSIAVDAQSPALNLVFANATVDFAPPPAPITSITCLFGNATVRLPRDYAVRTVCTCAFGSISTPKGGVPGFGDKVFVLGDGLQTQMEVKCVFGQVTILD
jgi:predicted membrane protein